MTPPRARSGILILAILGLSACSSPSPLKVPVQDDVRLEGNAVVWTTDEPVLGAVRYGLESGVHDRVAYPAAAQRRDKAFITQHRVPLLTAQAGETVYLQLLSRTPDGRLTAGREYEFTVATRGPELPALEWTMIDVGFGDSHLLTMPSTGTRVLVDAGERRDWPNVDLFLEDRGIDRLDVVYGTHIHADHIGGLVGQSGILTDGVLGAYEVDLFLDSPTKSGSRFAYGELLETLAERGIDRAVVEVGDTDATEPSLDWDPSVEVEVLNAGATGLGDRENDRINNDSIVLRVSFGEVDLLLGGDAEGPVETRMAETRGDAIESELLKVHHHGVNDATESPFLVTVNPRVGFIPITAFESNSGSLPTSEVLGRLRAESVDVYASDRAEPLGVLLTGDAGHNVTVLTDGSSYEVRVEASRSRHYAPSDEFGPQPFANPEDDLQ